jgi:hypothetical protein
MKSRLMRVQPTTAFRTLVHLPSLGIRIRHCWQCDAAGKVIQFYMAEPLLVSWDLLAPSLFRDRGPPAEICLEGDVIRRTIFCVARRAARGAAYPFSRRGSVQTLANPAT